MTWDWASSCEHYLRATSLPIWALLAATGLLGFVLLVTWLRTERTFANGLLAALAFASVALSLASQFRPLSVDRSSSDRNAGFAFPSAVPALACIDDMAGEMALAACEKALFGTPDTVAAAVAYASAQLSRLTAIGDVAAADREMTPQLFALRRAVERDRYGIFAYVLASRDNCQPEQCAAFEALADHNQVAANMNDLIYEGLVSRYAPSWNAVGPIAPAAQAGLTSGKPSTIDFPTAASIPPVNIMSAEPGPGASPPAPATAPAPPGSAPRDAPSADQGAARKPPTRRVSPNTTSSINRQKRQASSQKQPSAREPEGPVQLAPSGR